MLRERLAWLERRYDRPVSRGIDECIVGEAYAGLVSTLPVQRSDVSRTGLARLIYVEEIGVLIQRPSTSNCAIGMEIHITRTCNLSVLIVGPLKGNTDRSLHLKQHLKMTLRDRQLGRWPEVQ